MRSGQGSESQGRESITKRRKWSKMLYAVS